MKKILLLVLSLVAVTATSQAQFKDGYYNAMDGKKKEALKEAVKTCVSEHTRLAYYDLPYNWRYTDVYPELYNGNVRWWEMYSNNIYLIYPNQSPTQSFSANKMQREHSVPKSWWKVGEDVEYTPAYTDLWNLLPSDPTCNQAKSNYPFGNVEKAIFDNGSAKVGSPLNGLGGGAPLVFEPADEYKGDFARNIFYMACVYDELPWKYTYMFQQNSWPTLRSWAYNTLLEWHRNDPVSQKEIDRNNAVESQQGNRNPFIDFPNLAEYIWGEDTEKVFYLSDNDTSTPYPDEAYITQPVNNEALEFGQVAVGGERTFYLDIHGMITTTLSVSLSGTDRTMFQLGASEVSPNQINHTGTYLLPVSFNPTSEGEKTAYLLLYYGGLQGSVRVQLIGEGCPVPQLTRLTAYEPTAIQEGSYIANWSVAPEVVDYYVLTRTMYTEDGPETETLESDANSLQIIRYDDVMEAYSVQSSRLGYLSQVSNTITVAPYTGVFAVEGEAPFGVETDRNGFVLVGCVESIDAAVYDTAGRRVYYTSSLTPGEHISLPSGLYILTSTHLNRPFKILIP